MTVVQVNSSLNDVVVRAEETVSSLMGDVSVQEWHLVVPLVYRVGVVTLYASLSR